MNSSSLYRIYQGRIVSAEFVDRSMQLSSAQAFQSLSDTHCLFQDAVNYYLVALAGMADPRDTDSIMGQYRQEIAKIWSVPPKGQEHACSLEQSLCRSLNLGTDATIETAWKSIFEGNEEPKFLPHALSFIIDKMKKGESVIQQQGGDLFPKLCDSEFHGNFDLSEASVRSHADKKRLMALLAPDNLDMEALTQIAQEMDLSWVIKSQDKKFSPADTQKKVLEALEFWQKEGALEDWQPLFKNAGVDLKSVLSEAIEQLKQKPETEWDSCCLRRNNGGQIDKKLKWASIWFMYAPSLASALALKKVFPKDKKIKEEAATGVSSDRPYDYNKLSGDPLILTRGQRGYVFPAFSALPIWDVENGEIYSKKWDILAFKEALKTLHSFQLKTDERKEELETRRKKEDYILGKTCEWSPGGDEEEPVVLGGDPHYKLLEEMVSELSEPYGDFRYSISIRALHGYEKVQEAWKKSISEGKNSDTDLQDCVGKVQSSGKSFGSQLLFSTLCKQKYRPIWQDAPVNDGKLRSNNILSDYCKLQSLKSEIEKLEEPVRITAAEPVVSPRCLTYSDLDKLGKVKGCEYLKTNNNELRLAVVIRNGGGKWSGAQISVRFSAPRMERDELLSGTSAEQYCLQPLMKALELPETAHAALDKKPAVSLSVEKNYQGESRCLLNFPVMVKVDKLQKHLGVADKWNGQFLGAGDKKKKSDKKKKLHLHWPDTLENKKRGWWENPDMKGFRCLACDLGVRFAAAYASVEVYRDDPERLSRSGRPMKGRCLGSAGGHKWFGYLVKQGTLRLDGEGKAGKLSPGSETELGPSSVRLISEKEMECLQKIRQTVGVCEPLSGEISALGMARLAVSALRRYLSRYGDFLRFYAKLSSMESFNVVKDDLLKYFNYNEATRRYVPGIIEALQSNKAQLASTLLRPVLEEMRKALPSLAEQVTTLVLPRKKGHWSWESRNKDGWAGSGVMELLDSDVKNEDSQYIYRMGGISIDRISILEELRRQLQSMSRRLAIDFGESVPFGRLTCGQKVIDPCPEILRKIENMREQRVNQIAHAIAAQALGLRLKPSRVGKNEKGRDIIHGEYERIPGVQPADFVVLENLSRYKTNKDRPREENTTLMRWAHRRIVDKVVQVLEEVFGIPVLFTDAAYTSRFDSMTSIPGFRAMPLKSAIIPNIKDPSLPCLSKVLSAYRKILDQVGDELPKGAQLVYPRDGGEYFISDSPDAVLRHADMNAACNIGWRALASPQALDLLHRVRLESTEKGIQLRQKNMRENALKKWRFKLSDAEHKEGKYLNTYVDVCGQYKALGKVVSPENENFAVTYGVDMWSEVKAKRWLRCTQVNVRILEKAGFETEAAVLEHIIDECFPE